tara:strand:+ start:2192 stop:2929 length:738 start_codon:yes stop_codon:yes gene_type:complete
MPSRRRQRGGSINIPLSPTPVTGETPTLFPSNEAKVAGHGCAGTRLATAAAKGKYVPYSQGGGGVCLQNTPLTTRAGPTAGYASIKPCGNMVAERSLGMGAGVVGEVGQGAHANDLTGALYKGGRRSSGAWGSRRRRSGIRRRTAGGRSRRHRLKKHKSKKHRQSGGSNCSRKHSRKSRGRRSRRHRGGSKVYRGGSKNPRSGYTQLLSDVAYSQGYSAGGVHLGPKQSGLANPAPHTAYARCTE